MQPLLYFFLATTLLLGVWLRKLQKSTPPAQGLPPQVLPPKEKVDYDQVVPIADNFDYTKVDPIPYRPFQTKQHVAMGVRKMPKAEWIRMDKGYLKRLEERLEIINAHPAESIGSGPEVNPAIEELYEELMSNYLHIRFPTMFEIRDGDLINKVTGKTYRLDLSSLTHDEMLVNLGENVEEDFYFMCPDSEDVPRLQGWLACFPGGFLTTSRKGLSMQEIHSPVPGYQQRISKGADRALARLEGGDFIERFNWSLQTDGPDLFRVDGNNFYPEQGQIIPEEEDDINLDDCYLRVEHQTLVRLKRTRAIIFCVRSYMTTLYDIRAEGSGPLLAEAFESMPRRLGNYKKRPFWETPVYRFLRLE